MIHACSFILWPAGVIFNAGVTVSVKEQYQAVCFLVFWVQRHPNPINSQLLPGCFCFLLYYWAILFQYRECTLLNYFKGLAKE
jgi:hypothetical protein